MYKESFYNIDLEQDNMGRHLIFNANTLAVAWLDKDEYNFIHNCSDIMSDDSLDEMAKLGFIVDSGRVEQAEIQEQHLKIIKADNPSVEKILIAPTLKCNMHCKYCFESDLAEKSEMAWDDIPYVIEFIKKRIAANCCCQRVNVTWFGGEPTLEVEKIITISEALTQFCSQRNIVFSSDMISNGLLLTHSVAKVLHEKCGLLKVQITVDGMRKTYALQKGTSPENFDRVIQNIIDICQLIRVAVRVNAHPNNEDEIIELFNFMLQKHNLNKKIFMYAAPIFECSSNTMDGLYTSRDFITFSKRLEKEIGEKDLKYDVSQSIPRRFATSCGSISEHFVCIGPDMNLYRCEHLLGIPQYRLGTILGECFDNPNDRAFLGYQIEEDCINCKFYPVCHGGCRADRILYGITPDCEHMQEVIKFQVSNLLKRRNL